MLRVLSGLILFSSLAFAGDAVDIKPTPEIGIPLNLMPVFKAARDAVSGTWVYDEKAKLMYVKNYVAPRTTQRAPTTMPSLCLQLFTEVPPEYDFSITFASSGKQSIMQHLKRGGTSFLFEMNPGGEGFCTLDRFVRKPMPVIIPKIRHTSRVEVRDTGVKCYYDGNLVLELATDWKKRLSPLKKTARDMLIDDSCLGLSTNMDELVISEMTITKK